jgi:hypothetical protein
MDADAPAPALQYVTTPDGIDLAYAVAGEGDTVVQMPFHFNHVLMRWNGPIWFRGLAEHYRVVQYDTRGQGLSMRGPVQPTVADYGIDLETIIDTAQAGATP